MCTSKQTITTAQAASLYHGGAEERDVLSVGASSENRIQLRLITVFKQRVSFVNHHPCHSRQVNGALLKKVNKALWCCHQNVCRNGREEGEAEPRTKAGNSHKERTREREREREGEGEGEGEREMFRVMANFTLS